MILSDISVKRPVLAGVLSALLITLGILSYNKLPLRELPDIDAPVVSISTSYRGASSDVMESRITNVIEDQIRGIEGIRSITSSSRAGSSRISIEFNLSRNLDDAANDIRDAVSRVARRLPPDVDPPVVTKADSDEQVIIWYNLNSSEMNMLELSDYAERHIVDRLSVLDGVARVLVGGGMRYSMRIWIDRVAMAARGLTVSEIENALRNENLELPAGAIESQTRIYPVRVTRGYRTADDFKTIALGRGADGHIIRLGEVAEVEIGPSEHRVYFVGNGKTQVGLGIVKQSTANTLEVVRGVRKELNSLEAGLPEGMDVDYNYDSSIYIENAIKEVFRTLFIAVALVILVIYVFLGSWRAAIIPAFTVPVCLVGTFSILYFFGLSLNLMTLLAFVLSIGLVVDDSIVVLENIQRRIGLGEPPAVAAYRGARQVGFAVVATTVVLVSVFLPIMFLEGFQGKLFTELAITLSGAVILSSFVALSLSPMLCSKVLGPRKETEYRVSGFVNRTFEKISTQYLNALETFIKRPMIMASMIGVVIFLVFGLFALLPDELAPNEDRGGFMVFAKAPEGTNFVDMRAKMKEVEAVLETYRASGEFRRIMVRVPGSFSTSEDFSSGFAMVMLEDWKDRKRSSAVIMAELSGKLSKIPGVMAFARMHQGFGHGGNSRPLQVVLSGTEYDEIAKWRDIMLGALNENPGITRAQSDYLETRPEIEVTIDHRRASDLGVSVATIGRTLEAMMGTRRVTTFLRENREYDVILQAREGDRADPSDLSNIFVRSDRTGRLIPLSNVIAVNARADAGQRRHFNRLRSITISAGLAPGYPLGDALEFMEQVAATQLPESAILDYKGQSADHKDSSNTKFFTFGMAMVIVFLVLAAQFESVVHPLVIMTTVPLAIAGGLFGLYMVDSSVNVYSTIGLVILVGLSAKNGILIVEFANQLRDEGREFHEALMKACETRLRPILMTGTSTAFGALPLVLATGAGSASRLTIGIVIFSGVFFATFMTIFVVPVFYQLLAKNTKSPGTVAKMLNSYEEEGSIGESARSGAAD
jgi:multidrug efflux pump